MFGTILENVVLDELTRKVKFEDQSITENTRASYPLHYIPHFVQSGRGWHPKKYAEMLGKLIDEHESDVWLVNTGWTGGAFGVGKRMKLTNTRRMVHALLRGDLRSTALDTDP